MASLGLAAYGSDSDSEPDDRATVPQVALESSPSKDGRGVTVHPQPSTSAADFGARLPIVSRKQKRGIAKLPMFSKPVDATYGSDSDDEDAQARKRMKRDGTSKASHGALDFLPKPVHELPKPLREFPSNTSEAQEAPPSAQPQSAVPSAADLYRVGATGDYVHSDILQQAQQEQSATPAAWSDGGQDLFAAAVEAEQRKAEQRGKHLPLANVTFKEVDGAKLKELAPHEMAEVASIREALGTEYAQKLQNEVSGKNGPSKLSKRKHQIYSLYHHARMNELSDLEKKAQSMKSKAETHAKYGW